MISGGGVIGPPREFQMTDCFANLDLCRCHWQADCVRNNSAYRAARGIDSLIFASYRLKDG